MKKSRLTQISNYHKESRNLLVWKVFKTTKVSTQKCMTRAQTARMHAPKRIVYRDMGTHMYTDTNKFLVWKVCRTTEV